MEGITHTLHRFSVYSRPIFIWLTLFLKEIGVCFGVHKKLSQSSPEKFSICAMLKYAYNKLLRVRLPKLEPMPSTWSC